MANIFAQGSRVLTTRGQKAYDRLSGLAGFILFLVILVYAGIRGHRVVTQLPATFRTTSPPGKLPIEFVDALFPNSVPNATYEFPAVTVCAMDPAATVNLQNCQKVATATISLCDPAGILFQNLTFDGNTLSCVTVNDNPGSTLVAKSSIDELQINLSISGTRYGEPDGTYVLVRDQGQPDLPAFENMFTAAAFALTEVIARKVYDIAIDDSYKIEFETKATTVQIFQNVTNTAPSPVTIDIKYPKLEAVYEKEFLPLDMNNWLGEVGGVTALLIALHHVFVGFVAFCLLRSDSFSESKSGRPQERFEF